MVVTATAPSFLRNRSQSLSLDRKAFIAPQRELQGHRDDGAAAQPRLVGSREPCPRSAIARCCPLPAIGITCRHTRLVGVVMRAVLTESVPRLDVYQSEPVQKRGRVIRSL